MILQRDHSLAHSQEERVVEETVRKERIEVDDQSKTTRGRGTRQTPDGILATWKENENRLGRERDTR